MAIRITEDGVVNYENSPDVNRKLFPNLHICCRGISELAEEINGKAPVILSTASGLTASFLDGADDMALKSCVVTFEPIQEGSGDPSPENVRAISGRTGLTVYHSGSDTSDPTEISVNWESEAGTVYGGSLDVVSGKLVVDRKVKSVTECGFIWQEAYTRFYTSSLQNEVLIPASNVVNLICEALTPIANNVPLESQPSNAISIASSGNVFINNIAYTTTQELEDAIGESLVCYKIATPIEIQLTPQEIRTLLGENDIWSNAGSMSVEYPADTKMYIDQKITEAIAAVLA